MLAVSAAPAPPGAASCALLPQAKHPINTQTASTAPELLARSALRNNRMVIVFSPSHCINLTANGQGFYCAALVYVFSSSDTWRIFMRRRQSRPLSRKRLCKTASSTERGDRISMTQSGNHHLMNRREALLFGATASMSAALGPAALAMDNTKTAAHQQEPGNCATPKTAVANTQYGKVRGFVDGSVLTDRKSVV